MKLPEFEGWHLIGAFPDGDPDDVGSWLLVHNGEALLLEVPEGLTVQHVADALSKVGASLRCITASHSHEDHLDVETWRALGRKYPGANLIPPRWVQGYQMLYVGGEPVWFLKAPKHSEDDVVTIFRGVAMTGDIELGTIESVNDEVPRSVKVRSMNILRRFCADRLPRALRV